MGKPGKYQSGRKRWIHKNRIWVPIFMMIGISILSGGSTMPLGPVSFVGIDKIGHVIVYGLLAISWVRAMDHERQGVFWTWCFAVMLTTLFGLLDEWHQLYTPGRYFEWADLLADFVGAVVLSGGYLGLPAIREFMEYKLC